MVLQNLSTYLASAAVLISAVAWLYAYKCWDFCRDTEQYLKNRAKEPPPGAKKLTEIEIELTELADSLAALHVSMKKLRSRIGMRENRLAKRVSDSDIPDSNVDPAGYKRAMRLKLNSGQLK